MKTKTNELIGPALDWAVAESEGNVRLQYDSREGLIICNILGWIPYRPSVAWAQGGPIIEREGITLRSCIDGAAWDAELAYEETILAPGPTPLIAAMRCYVSSVLGEEVEVPGELL